MKKYAAFLRGVNIGGKNAINISELKNSLAADKFENIKSYINSGNLVFCNEESGGNLKEIIKKIIKTRFNLEIEVFIKTEKEIEQIINGNPFNENETDNSKRVVVMLPDKIDKKSRDKFKNETDFEENYFFSNDIIYVYYHNGAGRSKFTTAYIERKLGISSTGRNWNTIIKVRDMLNE